MTMNFPIGPDMPKKFPLLLARKRTPDCRRERTKGIDYGTPAAASCFRRFYLGANQAQEPAGGPGTVLVPEWRPHGARLMALRQQATAGKKINGVAESSRSQRDGHIDAGQAGPDEQNASAISIPIMLIIFIVICLIAICVETNESPRRPRVGDIMQAVRSFSRQARIAGGKIAESEHNFIGENGLAATKTNFSRTVDPSHIDSLVLHALKSAGMKIDLMLQHRRNIMAINLAGKIVAGFHADPTVELRPAQKVLRVVGKDAHAAGGHVQ